MKTNNFSSIKRDSVRQIFKYISDNLSVSRAEIATATDLSIMTVGKVVDAFLELDILSQSKEVKSVAGRKAGLVTLNTNNYSVVFDLTSKKFTMVLIDIALNQVDKIVYEYSDNFYFEENVYIFLKNSKIYLSSKFDSAKCIGYGFCVPGCYDAKIDKIVSKSIPELGNISISSIFNEIFNSSPLYVDSEVYSGAVSVMNSMHDLKDKCFTYVYFGNNRIVGTSVKNEVYISGDLKLPVSFGSTLAQDSRSLDSIISNSTSSEELIFPLASFISGLISTLLPDAIVLENDNDGFGEQSKQRLSETVAKILSVPLSSLPELRFSKSAIKHSHLGVAVKIRERWIDNIITNE